MRPVCAAHCYCNSRTLPQKRFFFFLLLLQKNKTMKNSPKSTWRRLKTRWYQKHLEQSDETTQNIICPLTANKDSSQQQNVAAVATDNWLQDWRWKLRRMCLTCLKASCSWEDSWRRDTWSHLGGCSTSGPVNSCGFQFCTHQHLWATGRLVTIHSGTSHWLSKRNPSLVTTLTSASSDFPQCSESSVKLKMLTVFTSVF